MFFCLRAISAGDQSNTSLVEAEPVSVLKAASPTKLNLGVAIMAQSSYSPR